MKKIIQITEENYNEIFLGNFQHKLENKFIIFIDKEFPLERVIYYCFKQNLKNRKSIYNIYGKFYYYKNKPNIYKMQGEPGIHIYDYLKDNKVFIF